MKWFAYSAGVYTGDFEMADTKEELIKKIAKYGEDRWLIGKFAYSIDVKRAEPVIVEKEL